MKVVRWHWFFERLYISTERHKFSLGDPYCLIICTTEMLNVVYNKRANLKKKKRAREQESKRVSSLGCNTRSIISYNLEETLLARVATPFPFLPSCPFLPSNVHLVSSSSFGASIVPSPVYSFPSVFLSLFDSPAHWLSQSLALSLLCFPFSTTREEKRRRSIRLSAIVLGSGSGSGGRERGTKRRCSPWRIPTQRCGASK